MTAPSGAAEALSRFQPTSSGTRHTAVHTITAMLAVSGLLLTGCGAPDRDAEPAAATSRSATTPAPGSPTPRTIPPTSIAAPAPDPGWADDVFAAGTGAYVVGWRADGAGALWWVDDQGRLSPRAAPPGTPGRPGTAPRDGVLGLAFDGPRTGLAITGDEGLRHRSDESLLVTHDGARTWQRVDLPTYDQPERIALGGGGAYALTNSCAGPGTSCDHATVWSIDPADATSHTFDTLPTRAGASDTTGTSLAAYGPTVWVLLDTGARTSRALRSSDGGRTWQRFDSGSCASEDLDPTSSDVVWSTCGGGMFDHFTRQVDGGSPARVIAGDVSGTSDSTLLPLTDTTAYAVVADRHGEHIAGTRDGGRTTSTDAEIPRRFVRREFRVVLVSARVGYLVTTIGGELYRTDDGGRRWRPVRSP